ncbi:MAG: polymerase/3-5 exonuclease PolX [Chitinophagaceae bacterium]|nr:polymerase/3-5 exonuclease PolX [Chitinophagaceae bacterium]
MDIHGENSFKAKSYSIAAFAIEQLQVQIADLPKEKIFSLKNIGESTGKKILEQLETGRLDELDNIIEKTPAGILEMLRIKGLGPKKISVIWKEMEIETLGELLYACNENRLSRYKGFGIKTQDSVKQNIEFYLNSQGRYLYAQIESFQQNLEQNLPKAFEGETFLCTGYYRRQLEIIDQLEFVTTIKAEKLQAFFSATESEQTELTDSYSSYKTKENVQIRFFHANEENLYRTLFNTSCSEDFLNEWSQQFPLSGKDQSEEEIFKAAGIEYIPPFFRESAAAIAQAKEKKLPVFITEKDIKAIIHSHSTWSDGSQPIKDMAQDAKEAGYEYLVISDHSKSAFYAGGLTEDRIVAQHGEIEELNRELAPFKIFKSIESDILNDGSLDYAPEVLASFDLVITSVHSNLKMAEEKAMMRLMRAIENPYTSILGHMTGRLLLSRNGYPVDYKKIIEACAANNVVIEVNAHPRRLDMDWRWIHYALDKGVLISVDPDAHSVDEYRNIRYGVLSAQKGGLTAKQNLSSFTLNEFEEFLKRQQAKRK